MLKGSCLCGKITYTSQQALTQLVFCHCDFCRKATSSAYSSNSLIAKASFTITTGADLLTTYSSSPGKTRHYCQNCHCQLFHTKTDQPDQIMLKLGTLDSWTQDMTQVAQRHIYRHDEFAWLEADL